MRKLLVAMLAAAVAGALTHAPEARAQAPQARALRAAQCGLSDARPLWIEYADGTVPFARDLFGRPGIVIATGGELLPPAIRERGAQTIFWEMRLSLFVGTTTKPADPAAIPAAAQRLFEKAVTRSGCATPLIALNELHGAGTTTPWSATNGQYRANVLELLRQLAARGARPFLLINSAPYTDGEAREWWLQAAQVADLVAEVYWHAPKNYKLGSVLANRRLRQGYRQAIRNFTEIGIPASRLGIMLGFQSGPGTGGREGLQPSSSWFRFVKWQTLAAKQVAPELGIATVWSWGWGTFSAAGADPDKQAAACVYLWARDSTLCDGPAFAGDGFDASLEEGQISLEPGVQCRINGKTITEASVARLSAVTRDREVAFTLLFQRLVESERARVNPAQVVAVERSLIEHRFGGNRSAYLTELRRARATPLLARTAIADALRRARLSRLLRVAPPTEAQIAAFYGAYPDALVRLVEVRPAPSWLGGQARGFALAAAAPADVFELPLGTKDTLATPEGTFIVRPLEQPLPLGALPLDLARGAIGVALAAFARAEAFDRFTTWLQTRALNRAMCVRDELPAVGAVRLSSYLPFLGLDGN